MDHEHRSGSVTRKTAETDIKLTLNLDGDGASRVTTGIGFFDHMLTAFAKHGHFGLQVSCQGDLEVDGHHTVEDVGLCLGHALHQAVGDKAGIVRFGSSYVPMDDALVLAVIDLGGRPFLGFDLPLKGPMVGAFDTGLTEEFFRAFSNTAFMNLHIRKLAGDNDHHVIEAAFKAVAKALDQATQFDPRVSGVLSTKGSLES